MSTIYPILLAGGSGNRLWPISRKSYPKQFSKLVGKKSLFQNSALRLISSDKVKFSSHIILTNYYYRFIVREQLFDVGIESFDILIEPEPKNTAPAILAASLFAYERDKEAILIVAPSDHVISDVDAFHMAIKYGLKQIENGKIVTFGIVPTYPETGYGYLELLEDNLDTLGTSTVTRFIEKPERDKAEQILSKGNFLWNSGIFMFKAVDMINCFHEFEANTLQLVKSVIQTSEFDLNFLRLNKRYWKDLKDISIDYAIMEKTKNLVAIPFSSGWSDLGSWESVWSEVNKDQSGVALVGNAHSIDCNNTLLFCENSEQEIIGLGLNNIVAIAMPDAVLVTQKNRSQDVKKVVENLNSKKIPQGKIFPKDYRPWGWFESLVKTERFQVKRIYVKPGEALSLQSHKYRSEHWTVVEGMAKVTVGETIKLIGEGQSVYVPLRAVHRLENPNEKPLEIIEVQTGTYLGEDDIIRYEDKYAR